MAKDRKQAKAIQRQAKLKSKQLHQQQVAQVKHRINDIVNDHSTDSVERLVEMHRAFPNDRNILVGLLVGCDAASDLRRTRTICRDWLVRHPQDREVWRTYVGACIQMGYVFTAWQAAQTIVKRWPDWEESDACRAIISVAEEMLPTMVKHLGPDTRHIVLERHEAVRSALEEGEFEDAIRLARQALLESPECHPIRNNLVQSLTLMGRYAEAIRECDEQVRQDPHNVFAWVSLTRALYLLGRDAEAQAALQSLLACESDRIERWVKTAEALAVLGEDQRLLDWARPVISGNLDMSAEPVSRTMLRHYAACSEYRLGNERAAKTLWRDALKISDFSTAQQNLAELEKPIDKRDAAWFFAMGELFSRKVIDDFLAGCHGMSNTETTRFARGYFEQHPELRRLTQVLLDRGDPLGRELATRLCKIVADEQSLDLLEAFARGQRGPLELRLQMTDPLISHGRMEPGQFLAWKDGKPSEVLALAFQISFEPLSEEPNNAVMDIVERAHAAMRREDNQTAEMLFEKATQLAPDDPSHHFNLTSLRQLRPEYDYPTMMREIHNRWPDYEFARMSLATLLARRGQVQEARDLVLPILKQTVLHFTQFRALAMCHVEIEIAAGRIPEAKIWLDMTRRILSDDTQLIAELARQIAIADPSRGVISRLKSLFRTARPS